MLFSFRFWFFCSSYFVFTNLLSFILFFMCLSFRLCYISFVLPLCSFSLHFPPFIPFLPLRSFRSILFAPFLSTPFLSIHSFRSVFSLCLFFHLISFHFRFSFIFASPF